MLRDIKDIMSKAENIDSACTQMEVNRGRAELRTVRVSSRVEAVRGQWAGLSQAVEVERLVVSKGKKRSELHYYISSLKTSAFRYAEGIRLHWMIENGLHYVKDVTLKEDKSRIRSGYAPQNLSTLKNIALNILRTTCEKCSGIAKTIRLIAHNIKGLKQMIM